MTKVLFTTDIHGSDICFKKFVAAAGFYEADIIIMGGDCTGKMLVPCVKNGSGYSSTYLDKEWLFATDEELADFERRVSNAGYYPIRLSIDEVEALRADEALVDALFTKTMKDTLGQWLDFAEQKLKGTGVTCIITPGNDDHLAIDDVIDANNFVVQAEGKVINLDEQHEMLSLGWSNPTPWNTPRECSEEELASENR